MKRKINTMRQRSGIKTITEFSGTPSANTRSKGPRKSISSHGTTSSLLDFINSQSGDHAQ